MSVMYVKAPMLCRYYVDPGLAQKLLDRFCSNSYKTCGMSQDNYAKYIFFNLKTKPFLATTLFLLDLVFSFLIMLGA